MADESNAAASRADELKQVQQQFYRIGTMAVVGACPIVGALLLGFGPLAPGAAVVTVVSALVQIVGLALALTFVKKRPPKVVARWMVGSLVVLVLSLGFYIHLNGTKVGKVEGQRVWDLGTKPDVLVPAVHTWITDRTEPAPDARYKSRAAALLDYRASHDFLPKTVWRREALDTAQFWLFTTWLIFCLSIAVLLGTFLVRPEEQSH